MWYNKKSNKRRIFMAIEVHREWKQRTEDQPDRKFLVNYILKQVAIPNGGLRIEFSELLKKINLLISTDKNCVKMGRIELSRCLRKLNIEVNHYRGTHLPGYQWIEDKPALVVPHRIDPEDFFKDWMSDDLRIERHSCTTAISLYLYFNDWCTKHKKPLCTITMFTRRLKKHLEETNKGRYTEKKYCNTILFSGVYVQFVRDKWLEHYSNYEDAGLQPQSFESYCKIACRRSVRRIETQKRDMALIKANRDKGIM
jgi:hypothetical protein